MVSCVCVLLDEARRPWKTEVFMLGALIWLGVLSLIVIIFIIILIVLTILYCSRRNDLLALRNTNVRTRSYI